jgi:transcription initiation factor TFIID subunit 9B
MATNGHPATPPPSDPSANSETKARPEPEVPLTSTQDDGQTKRPRDARLIHVVLSSLGIHSYQERVPLQLLDFAYRYTSGVLSDSLRLSAEGYASQTNQGNKRNTAGDDSNAISVTALRQAIASRQGYTFQGPLAKEFMMEQASERNRVALPKVDRSFGVQLPPEKYCLTGVGWGLREGWESDEDVTVEDAPRQAEDGRQDEQMGGMDGAENEDEDEEGTGRMEDVFGTTAAEDTSMAQD